MLFDDDLGIVLDIVGFHDQVHGERLIRDAARLADVRAHHFGHIESGLDDTQAARLAHSASERAVRDVGHGTLDDGIFDAEQFGQLRFHRASSFRKDCLVEQPILLRTSCESMITQIGNHSRYQIEGPACMQALA